MKLVLQQSAKPRNFFNPFHVNFPMYIVIMDLKVGSAS